LLVQFRRLGRRHVHYGIVAIGRDRAGLIAEYADGVAAFPDRADPGTELVTEHRDPAIGRAKMLESVHRDWTLRDLGLEVARAALTLLVGIRTELAGQHDAPISPPGWRGIFGLADVT